MATPLQLPILARSGITLRPWRLTNAPALRHARGDEQIMRFTTVPAVYTEKAAADWISRQRQHAERGTAAVFAITDSDERAPVGMVGLFGLDRGDHAGRLGYWLLGHARGRSLATAAGRALTEWAFVHLHLEQVVIEREPGNHASARLRRSSLRNTPVRGSWSTQAARWSSSVTSLLDRRADVAGRGS